MGDAAPFAGQPGAAATVIDMPGALPGAPPPNQTLFQQSSHPVALIFHLLFRSLAIVAYVFANWVFASKFILGSVIIILCLAFDFWTVKNVTGRLLVGLRWWNEIKEDGSNVWIFESKEVPFTELLQNESYTLMLQQNRQVNAVDSRIFWYSMYITLTTWVVFAFVAIIGLKVSWAVLSLVAVFMNMANVIGYTKCEKDAKNKIANYLAGQSAVQGWVGSMVSNQLGSMFTGAPQQPASRV